MTSAASSSSGRSPPETVTVLATEQPLPEIVAGLESRGYRREGDVLVTDRVLPGDAPYPAVAMREGLVAIGVDREAVEGAIAP